MTPRRIAFFSYGTFSEINPSLIRALGQALPDCRIEEIDLRTAMKRAALPLAFHALWQEPRSIATREALTGAARRTPFAFEKAKRLARSALENRGYALSIQTQSMFDLSVPGVPHFVYTDHTLLENFRYPNPPPPASISRARIARETTIYRNAFHNFTMSGNITSSIVHDYGCDPSTVTCVYAGPNATVNEDELFDDGRFAAKEILFVGIDWMRKGGPDLVEAFKAIRTRIPDARLTIVGCRPDLKLENCREVGRVPLRDVKKYFSRASVFCLPTLREPFGNVFIEAMAHGLPVIGTSIGPIPGYIENGVNGYLVEPGNVQQLADRLERLLNGPQTCKRYGQAGRDLVFGTYTWNKTARRIADTIRPWLT